MPLPFGAFSRPVLRASERLSVSDLVNVRVQEKALEFWFENYQSALGATDRTEFEARLKEGSEKVSQLRFGIMEKAGPFVLSVGKSFLTTAIIDAALGGGVSATVELLKIFGPYLSPVIEKAVSPIIGEILSDAPENDVPARARRALSNIYTAFTKEH